MNKVFLILFLLTTVLTDAISQGKYEPVTFSSVTYGIMVHRPDDWYDSVSKKYPAIIFLVGAGEVGNDSVKTYAQGPNWAVKQGWDGVVNLGDSSFKCLVITFQRNINSSSPAVTVRGIDSIIARYRVDTSRMYVTGLSLGGQTLTRMFTETGLSETNYYKYKRFTAAVPMSNGKNIGGNRHSVLSDYATLGGSIMYLRGENDGLAWPLDSIANYMNPIRAGSAIGYDWTTAEAGGDTHCCWNHFYDSSYRYPGLNLSIYQWMLGHSKHPFASATQSVINTNSSSISLTGVADQYSWGYNGWGRTVSWSKKSGGSATITMPLSSTTTVTGLTPGTYVFTFKSQNSSGEKAEYDVTVNVADAMPPGTLFKSQKTSGWKVIN